MTTPSFEQGPIRPPSEAASLLVRVVRNCGWNRCTFCPVYKGARFSLRPVADVVADIDAMAAAAEALGDDGLGPLRAGEVPPEAFQVALFLRDAGRSAFLQDADPCALATPKLVAVLEHLRARFPTVARVTTYGRASTLARRTPEQVASLAAAGLTRVHVGMESGSDVVLRALDKGCSAAQLVTAAGRVLGAGLELCFYVMPGIGGRELAAEHVRGTADTLRSAAALAPAGDPLVVRLRTAAVAPGTPLECSLAEGGFELPDDVEVAREVRDLLVALGDARLELRSDHALNLFADLEGSLPHDREALVATLEAFLGLASREQAEFALGARLGLFRRLDDRLDPGRRAALLARAPGAGAASAEQLLAAATGLRSRFI